MKAIFTALSPNLQSDDVRLAARLGVSFGDWVNGEAGSSLESEIRKLTGATCAAVFASGRSAMSAALRAAGVQPGDEVLLQAYTCVAVPDAVLWVQAIPKYVDIEDDYLMSAKDLQAKITSRARILIVQHTFSSRERVLELIKIGRSHGLVIIEDCAHALGSRVKGLQAGMLGDIGVFSFGRDKVLSSVFGGAAITCSQTYADKLRIEQGKLVPPPRAWVFQQLMHPLLTWVIRATYDLIVGRILLSLTRKFKLLSRPVEPQEKRGIPPSFFQYRISNALAVLAINQLRKLESFRGHRERITRYYDKSLFSDKLIKPILQGADPAFLRYPIQVAKAKALLAAAARDKIFLGDWYQQSIAPEGVEYPRVNYDRALCPKSELMTSGSLNLPTHIGITESQAADIVKWLLAHI
ncbi:MAG: hypothetical protein A2722_01980 [Candidatus Doudnabacteria bacterium RIFCSPHIGHO2_01_FULL_50_11]|uniref:Uncharacterized protein n=1 Tax=Candidatus Doudnabacteria bacterium RIFCSPHIGHO2_01_FULL_50_11 TaxID=1817828 RepID=A0A1F5PMT9_9BACT|nr:MAG: hypothetical protein A2722_01980 [Candidatus Doudnabacteria bacterium RIFCSPHIGHO2_01_FULL_50_11]